ncbi:MAG TPA: outer membrane beta-barrel protein, partial [Candidatus Sulfotelmatobacter sp.]|nr:outer membrane beta-barrel protein [Candidatus Sulfotelmatobacter sp.]
MLAGLSQAMIPIQSLAQSATQHPMIAAEDLPAAETKAAATGADRANSNVNASNAEILAELARMRARIAELEARLKTQNEDEATVAQPKADDKSLVSSSWTPMASAAGAAAQERQTVKPLENKPADPFAFADFTWLNGTARTKEPAFDSTFFTPEIRADVDYIYDFNHPSDDTIGGSSEVFRANEFQLTQLGVGGDFHFDNVQARVMTQFGMYSQTTPRNDASPARGQWNLADAYRYISEAYGGYHINKMHGINIQAGIFMSYVGLFSYYNFDNWAYQPSYVSSNTPWFFNGMRVQFFPTDKLKIEPWLVNGWQSYGRF